MREQLLNGWVEEATADNAAAAATHAATGSQQHYLAGFDVSYSAAVAAVKAHTLVYTDPSGATITLTFPVNYALVDGRYRFPVPLRCGENTDAVLTAAASGTGGVTSRAHLYGFTV